MDASLHRLYTFIAKIVITTTITSIEHHFVECRLTKMWTNQHLLGFCSAMNRGHIFMETFPQGSAMLFETIEWPFISTLTTEHIWDMFVLLALLLITLTVTCSMPSRTLAVRRIA
ncbi:hypothetical protein BDN67DRAFT_1016487 [Paxillus ammoniavirescens]|nr:hypothetical protein BDN67DRAFT_1016487 [Paxillus ammoniavirescens]